MPGYSKMQQGLRACRRRTKPTSPPGSAACYAGSAFMTTDSSSAP